MGLLTKFSAEKALPIKISVMAILETVALQPRFVEKEH
jgi:hypothetical protein